MTVEGARGVQLSVIDRIVMSLAGLVLVVLGIDLAASAVGYQGPGSLAPLLERWGGGLAEGLVSGALALFLGAYVLVLCVRQEEDEGIRQETEMGHVRISLRAIENLVRRVAAGVKGIKEVDVAVHPSPEGVAVALSLVVHPEVPIPVLSEDVARRVRDQVRETTGIDVGDVSVSIRNIAGASKSRVE
ncbi:MAG: alkaline shock response membrane anchor protein AmaP [Clostridia bacterium]|nr:hypothetical protein [Bacillota bacterium]MBO2520691.1 hypothetical protein [Bacillota bacterium]